uniref:AlNc14C46G3737 protein n=1 Tax=Albugo laibachii Nc14 TaxID=890382 RepID=F0WAL3_9STRA|nr:AlNc14C46G3737 [Albugo laibachii Nc14]|eukprot:CCA18184.1 AlNc14C46G3737 [Albugo laibachii Nc14]
MDEDLDADLCPPPWIDMKVESYIFMTYTRSTDSIPDSWSDPFCSISMSSSQNRPYISGIDNCKFGITRIYVSTEASVQSGRANWGIPKQLAKFRFYKSRDCFSQLWDHVEVSSLNGNSPFSR